MAHRIRMPIGRDAEIGSGHPQLGREIIGNPAKLAGIDPVRANPGEFQKPNHCIDIWQARAIFIVIIGSYGNLKLLGHIRLSRDADG